MLELQTCLPGLEISDDENGNGSFKNKRKKRTLFSKFDQNNRNDEESGDEEANGKAGSDGEESFHDDEDAPLEIEEENPLLAKFEKESKTSSWFNKVCLTIEALNWIVFYFFSNLRMRSTF